MLIHTELRLGRVELVEFDGIGNGGEEVQVRVEACEAVVAEEFHALEVDCFAAEDGIEEA